MFFSTGVEVFVVEATEMYTRAFFTAEYKYPGGGHVVEELRPLIPSIRPRSESRSCKHGWTACLLFSTLLLEPPS